MENSRVAFEIFNEFIDSLHSFAINFSLKKCTKTSIFDLFRGALNIVFTFVVSYFLQLIEMRAFDALASEELCNCIVF